MCFNGFDAEAVAAFLQLGPRRDLLKHRLSSSFLVSELRTQGTLISWHVHPLPPFSSASCLWLVWKAASFPVFDLENYYSQEREQILDLARCQILALGGMASGHNPSSSEPLLLFPSPVTVAFLSGRAGQAFP